MLKFLTGRPLWINILVGLVLSFLLVFIFFQTLQFWTNHGEYLKVPDVKGKTLKEAAQLLEKNGFEIVIQDSVFNDTLPPLAVTKQFPDPDATVKVNRTVYLTINRSEAPDIDMPNLIGMSFRNAEQELRARGLKLGDTSYVPDIAKNAVKDQTFNGESIKPATKIRMGSVISLVLGAGVGDEEIAVPDLIGLQYPEAVALLEGNGINLGVVLPDADLKDTTAGFVYWQSPPRFNEERKLNRIRQGQIMDMRLSVAKPERKIDSAAQALPAQTSNDY